MPVHIDARTTECYTFGLQPESLFESAFAGQRDFAAGAHDPMPRQSRGGGSQRPDHLPSAARKTGGKCDISIGSHFTSRDLPDGVAQDFKHAYTAYTWLLLYHAKVRRSPSSNVY